MANIINPRIIAPRRDLERETRGSAPGRVKSYTLPRDEIDRIFAKVSKLNEKAPIQFEKKVRAKKRMENPASGLTKEMFLKQYAAGGTFSAIEREYGMTKSALRYWVRKRWEITDDQLKKLGEGTQ